MIGCEVSAAEDRGDGAGKGLLTYPFVIVAVIKGTQVLEQCSSTVASQQSYVVATR